MSEDKVRAEFEAAYSVTTSARLALAAGRTPSGNYANPAVNEAFCGFKLGRQSTAKGVPVEALAEVLRISDRAHPAWEECKAFLRTIEEMKQ